MFLQKGVNIILHPGLEVNIIIHDLCCNLENDYTQLIQQVYQNI